MLNFIPPTILQQLCQQYTNELKLFNQVPFSFQLNSVVLVSELRNFYGKKRDLLADETQINEGLVDVAQTFYEIFTQFVSKYGGEIVKFMGTTIVAIWPTPNETDS
jgi:hypothetical protein